MAETLPPIPVAFSPQVTEEPRVRKVQFGDGYSARIPDGLNTQGCKVSIPWKNRTHQETAVLLDFFRRHGGSKWFLYVVHGESTPRKFICSKWDWSRSSNSSITNPRFDLSAELVQVFDLI